MTSWRLVSTLAALALGTGCAADVQDDGTEAADQNYEDIDNGIKLANGLKLNNGIKLANGLKLNNGIKLVNGVETVNGIKLANGVKLANGLVVDCSGGLTPGSDCTGQADGLFSSTTGLLSASQNDAAGTGNGIQTAEYIVKCALPEGTTVSLLDYTGTLQTFQGKAGLAPSFEYDGCDSVCEEKISACLIALTNGAGNHVNIEMSSWYVDADRVAGVNPVTGVNDDSLLTIGTGHSSYYTKQEIAAFGNLFSNPPSANYCSGSGMSSGTAWNPAGAVEERLCGPGSNAWTNCKTAYKKSGVTCGSDPGFDWMPGATKRCTFPCTTVKTSPWSSTTTCSDTASTCKDTNNKVWNYPITTFVH